MPTAVEVPPVDAFPLELEHHDPDTASELGVKGVGEAGVLGIGGAVANAVADALGERGSSVLSLPLTPDSLDGLVRGV